MNNQEKPMIYFCATPIGNLGDITLRVLRTLKEVDLIAAEDTRHSIKLLNHFNIKTPLTSYHQHNEISKGDYLIGLVRQGKSIALISDAGMPGISDPGQILIKKCIAEGIPFTLLPGANAGLSGLILSGLSTEFFAFEGFLSRYRSQRKKQIERIKKEVRTIILYESPNRVIGTLKELRDHLGDRQVALARELTKHYEEVWRSPMGKAIEEFQNRQPKGEFVLVIEGLSPEEEAKKNKKKWESFTILEHIDYYLGQGESKKEAIKKVAKDRSLPKREVYRHTIK